MIWHLAAGITFTNGFLIVVSHLQPVIVETSILFYMLLWMFPNDNDLFLLSSVVCFKSAMFCTQVPLVWRLYWNSNIHDCQVIVMYLHLDLCSIVTRNKIASGQVWNPIRDMRMDKLQAPLIFRSQGSFSQLLVQKKCTRLTTVKTCSGGPCYHCAPPLLCSIAFIFFSYFYLK